jgi:tetratricopeptide (TPR) repeat protein
MAETISELERIYGALQKSRFSESILFVLEHMFGEEQTPETFCRILSGLLLHGKYDAIKWLVSGHKGYLEYEEIKEIYIESMCRLGLVRNIEQGFETSGKELRMREIESTPVKRESARMYYKAVLQRGRERGAQKEMLSQALEMDCRNLEALIAFSCNYPEKELRREISKIEDVEVRAVYEKMFFWKMSSFSIFTKRFLSPFSSFRLARAFFNGKSISDSFQLAHYMSVVYPSHHLALVAIAFYYILTKNYTDAKRALFQSIQMNDSLGISWLLLGHCQTFLYESVNSISCYEKAEALMEESEGASLGIAQEYHKMRSYKKAEAKYTEIMGRYGAGKCVASYASLLIASGRYEEALDLCRSPADGKTVLIKVFCHLFTSQLHLAEEALKQIDVEVEPSLSRKYSILKGYISHLKGEFCKAIEMYQISLVGSEKGGNILNDLLELAIKNTLENDDKKIVCEYGEDLFEYLDLKSEGEIRV